MKLKFSAVVALALASSASLGAAEKLTTGTINVFSVTPLPSIGLPLNLIPANIQSTDIGVLKNQAGVSLADYMNNNMQGVTVADMTGSPWQPEINFRGYTSSPMLGNPQGLSTYVDGVRVNEPFGDVTLWDKIPSFAIKGMQLIPGSNPMYGLNTLGGAIAIQTKSGREAKGVGLEFEAGSWGRQRSMAEFGGVSKDGSVDYYVGVQHTTEDGWRKYSPTHLNQGFAKLGWQNESTRLNLSYIRADNNLIGNGFTPENLLSGDRDQIHTRPDYTNNYSHHLALNGEHWLNKDIMLSGNAYYRKSNRHTVNGDAFEHGAGGVNWTVDRRNPYGLADDGEYTGSVMNYTQTKQDTFGGKLQASFNQDLFGKKNLFVTGLGYEYTSIKFNQFEHANIGGEELGDTNGCAPSADCALASNTANTPYIDGLSTSVFDSTRAPILAGNGLLPKRQTVGLTAKQFNYSVFASDTLSITDKLALNMGASWNYTKILNTDFLNGRRSTSSSALGYGSLDAEDRFHRINPTLGLVFNPQENLTLFSSYSESNRAPTAIELGCSNPLVGCLMPAAMTDDPPLKQVVAKTYELGSRGKLNDSINWNAAVYSAVNHDDIQWKLASASSSRGFFSNVGRTKREGLDLGLSTKIDKFTLSTSYSYIRATYDNDVTFLSDSNSSATGTNTNTITAKQGDRIPSIPEHQLKLRGQYQATPDWSIGANLIAYSEQYVWGNENNEHQAGLCGNASACANGKGKVDAYYVVNLDTQYNIGKGWSAFAKATNIFDHDYDVSGRLLQTQFNSAGVWGSESHQLGLVPGAPRAGWVGVRFEFGGNDKKD